MMSTSSKLPIQRDPLIKDLSILSGDWIVFGLTADPVHKGHIELAKAACSWAGAKGVIWIPAKQNPLKENAPKASDQDRINMLRLALSPHANMYVTSIEIDRSGNSYTIDTIRELQKLAGGINVRLLIGADQLHGLHKWKDFADLIVLTRPIVVARSGSTKEEFAKLTNLSEQQRAILESSFIEFDYPISSTAIRDAFKSGNTDNVLGDIEACVADYIASRNLYRS